MEGFLEATWAETPRRGPWSRVEGTGSVLTHCLSGTQSEGKLREERTVA